MRFTILASGLSALWLALPAFSLPTSPSARTRFDRSDIQPRDAEPPTTRTDTVLDDQVAKRQWGVKYSANLGDDLGTDAESENLLQPDWWLPATRPSGKEYVTVEPPDLLPSNILLGFGRGSGRNKQDMDFDIITRG